MSLLGTQNYFKPFEHPWMFDYWDLQQQMHWIPNDVPLNTDVKDWFTRITSNRVKAGLITGASQAQYTNLKGKDPIPAYIYGEEFGKSSSPDKGSFY